jgi:hypothetical protein
MQSARDSAPLTGSGEQEIGRPLLPRGAAGYVSIAREYLHSNASSRACPFANPAVSARIPSVAPSGLGYLERAAISMAEGGFVGF